MLLFSTPRKINVSFIRIFSLRSAGSAAFFGGVFFLLMLPFAASSEGVATFSISPASGTYGVSKSFTVSIMADSPSTFNSANATIAFDPSRLSVTGVSKNNSAFSLWAVEPSFDNTKGSVSFEGGNTTPLSGKKTLLAVTFKTLKEGSVPVTFTSGSVLAADGKGTDIAGAKNGATFEVSAAAPADPPPVSTPTVSSGPKPEIPEVVSSTHPDENIYYNSSVAKFTWDLPGDVFVVRLVLDAKENTVPTTSYDPAISEKEFDKLTDGEMYFHLRYSNDAGWGPTLHKKIKVDITSPPPFTLETKVLASSTDAELSFMATDTLSGIDRYEIVVDGGAPIKVPSASLQNGTYMLSGQEPGDHGVKVIAFDKAGNNTSVESKFSIEGTIASAKKFTEEEAPTPTDWRLIGDILLIALIAFLIGYLWFERSAFRHEKYIIKRESDELRDNMANVFAALRDEVGEQAGRLFEKPNPSAEDRDVMQEINEAIDLSEELLSKEVEDVRKLLS